MRHRLHSEVVYSTCLKDWDFACHYERAPRAIRVKLARSAKRRSRQLLKTEIDTFEDDHFPWLYEDVVARLDKWELPGEKRSTPLSQSDL